MRAVIQRVSEARVMVQGETVGAIGQGLLVLAGVTHADTEADVRWMARKIAGLRIFEDEAGRLNLSVQDVGGSVLVVSQFTLYADARRGRRPDFIQAARPEVAEPLVQRLVTLLREEGVPVATGQFGATMQVYLCNEGPVTIILETEGGKPR